MQNGEQDGQSLRPPSPAENHINLNKEALERAELIIRQEFAKTHSEYVATRYLLITAANNIEDVVKSLK